MIYHDSFWWRGALFQKIAVDDSEPLDGIFLRTPQQKSGHSEDCTCCSNALAHFQDTSQTKHNPCQEASEKDLSIPPSTVAAAHASFATVGRLCAPRLAAK